MYEMTNYDIYFGTKGVIFLIKSNKYNLDILKCQIIYDILFEEKE